MQFPALIRNSTIITNGTTRVQLCKATAILVRKSTCPFTFNQAKSMQFPALLFPFSSHNSKVTDRSLFDQSSIIPTLAPNQQVEHDSDMFNPPPVANATANDALNQSYGGNHATPAIRVAHASKRKEMVQVMYNDGKITIEELGEQELFYLQVVSSALPAGTKFPGAPDWFGPAMAQALGPVYDRLDSIETRLDNTDSRLDNTSARQSNSTVFLVTDTLQPILNDGGNPFPKFPATLLDLCKMTPQERGEMLEFFGMPQDPIETREQRLQQLIGKRP